MRAVAIADPAGRQLEVKQLGAGAEDPNVCPGARVIFFFLTAQKAWKSGENGSMWAYEESVPKIVGNAGALPRLSHVVSILAE